MDKKQPDTTKNGNKHPFEQMTDFDTAMKKLVKVPKEDVEEAEQQVRTPRPQR